MRKFTSLLVAAAALAVSPAAVHAQANPSTAAVQGGEFKVESWHTRVGFALNHMGFSDWYGEFYNVTGSLSLDPKDVTKAKIDIVVPIDSVQTPNAKLNDELKSPMFLDAAQFPQAHFVSKRVVRTGARTANVFGDLTLHGVTRAVVLKASFNGSGVNPMTKGYTVGFNATGKFQRSDFGIKTYVPVVADEVTLRISAAFERQ